MRKSENVDEAHSTKVWELAKKNATARIFLRKYLYYCTREKHTGITW